MSHLPEPHAESPASPAPAPHTWGGRSWVLIVPLTLALVCAGLSIASGAFGVLTGVLFPPTPSLPVGAREVWHTSEAWGADRWNYQIGGEACAVIAQIETLGGVCMVVPGQCGRTEPVPDSFYDDVSAITARCTGSSDFSIFSQRWNTVVAPGGIAGETRLQVERQVRWGG